MTITCGVLGYPPPTIIWSKTNGAISNRASMSISTTTFVGSSRLPYVRRNLTFTNSYREDAGSYQCRANNSAGIDTRSFIITVQCTLQHIIYMHTVDCYLNIFMCCTV